MNLQRAANSSSLGATAPLALGVLFFVSSLLSATEELDYLHCLGAYDEKPWSWDSANCFYRVARFDGSYEEARNRVIRLAQHDPVNPNLILVRAYLEEDKTRREQLCRSAQALFFELGDIGGQLRSLDALWDLLRRQDRITEAEDQIGAMQKLLPKTEDPYHHARVALVKARHLFEVKKDFAGALNELVRYQQLFSSDGVPYRLRHRFLSIMGRSHFELGMAEKAYGYFSRTAELAHSAKDPQDEAIALRNMLSALRDQLDEAAYPDDQARAIQVSRSILARARATDFADATVTSLLTLGDLVGGDEANALYEECAQLAAQFGIAPENRTCRLRLATLRARSDPNEGLSMLDRIRVEIPRSSDPLEATYDVLNEIRVIWAAGDYERAWNESTAALDTIENLRDLQERDFGRSRSFSAWAATYSWLAGRLLTLYQRLGSEADLERAFEVGERLRARMLLDIFETMNATPTETPQLRAKRSELREVLSERNKLQSEIRNGVTFDTGAGQEKLDELHEKERIIRGTISQLSGRFADLERPAFAKLAEIQEALLPNEALLTFQLAPERSPLERFAGGSWLIVISADSTKVYNLGDGYEIGRRARILSELLEQGRSADPLSIRLYEDLLEKGLSDLPPVITDLILISDKMLHRIPLAVLRRHQDAAPLGALYRISRIPSATLWLQRWREVGQPPPALQPALVIADPISEDLSLPLGPRSQTDFPSGSENGRLRATYGDLPFAKQEGWSIRRQLGPGTEMLVGPAASESALKSMSTSMSLERFGILHFAAHAIADEVRPDRAGIVLTRDRDDGGAQRTTVNDGILEFNEIVDLGFAGRVVVLSTCHSARGQILRGEGVFDLARAFFQAGARAVVGSLWRLEDRATARFFDDFYRHLALGTSLSEALHLAQKDQIERGAPPSAWAGIVVIGDGSLVPFPDRNGRFHPGWVILAALLVLAVAVFVAAKRPSWELPFLGRRNKEHKLR